MDLNALHTMLIKGSGGVGKQSDRMKHVVNDDGFKHVELKVAIRSTYCYSSVVAHNLNPHDPLILDFHHFWQKLRRALLS